MIVECGNCHAKYNVDDKKIPPAGVKVRCHKCQNILVIQKPEPVPFLITPVPPPEVQEPTPLPPEPPKEKPEPEPEVPVPPPTEAPSPPVAEEPVEPPPPPEVAPPFEVKPAEPKIAAPEIKEPAMTPATDTGIIIEKPEPPPTVPKLSEDDKKWQERARRLAKALASDLVLYNQDKVEKGLQDGTLAQLLGSEIRRSWEYYCQQIPKHIVESTDFFKEQLNKIVGKGKEIFK
jgi:predicted Zn finger-like uncharacterized protein